MTNTSHLYLLVFPQKNILKIGKADSVHDRIQQLKNRWGEVDYAASYQLAAPIEVIFKIEKALHNFLVAYSLDFESGDGKTEFFSFDALEIALKHIEIFTSTGAVVSIFQKGISKPATQEKSAFQPKDESIQFQQGVKAFSKSISRINAQFEKINRLLLILIRRQSRISYQYDFIDGDVYFRILRPVTCWDKLEPAMISRLFDFTLEGVVEGECGTAWCRYCGRNGIIQYKISLSELTDPNWRQPVLAYFFEQSEQLLKKLPIRSAAAIDEIPLLNAKEISESIRMDFSRKP